MRPLSLSLVLPLALGLLAACDNGASDLAGPDLAASTTTGQGAATAGAPADALRPAAPFRCDEAAAVEYPRSVTGTIDAQGIPTDVTVFPTGSPELPLSYRAQAKRMRTYQGPVDPGYVAWNVTGHPPGTPVDDYVLVIPRRLPPPGGFFSGELHIWFNHGQYGWWQTIKDCTIG